MLKYIVSTIVLRWDHFTNGRTLNDMSMFRHISGLPQKIMEIPQSFVFAGAQQELSSNLGIQSEPFTLSVWVKKNRLDSGQCILGNTIASVWTNTLGLTAQKTIQFNAHISTLSIDSATYWHHIVLSGGNLYVNGNLEETGWTGSINPSSIGYEMASELSEYHFIDGMTLGPHFFGTERNGEWLPIEYNGEHGAKGFYLPFHVNDAGKDESGNNNNFTHRDSGNVASPVPFVTADTPTRNYPTGDPTKSINNTGRIPAMEWANTHILGVTGGGPTHNHAFATLPFPTYGKWYFEMKVVVNVGTPGDYVTNLYKGYSSGDEVIQMRDAYLLVPAVGAAGSGLRTNQTMSIAIDMENGLFNHWFNGAAGHVDVSFDATLPLIWGPSAWSSNDNFNVHLNYGQWGLRYYDAIVSARPEIQDYLELNSANMENT